MAAGMEMETETAMEMATGMEMGMAMGTEMETGTVTDRSTDVEGNLTRGRERVFPPFLFSQIACCVIPVPNRAFVYGRRSFVVLPHDAVVLAMRAFRVWLWQGTPVPV